MNYARPNLNSKLRLLYVLLAVVGIKSIFLVLDPSPAYFLGDSESYLATAVIHWIPPDRSFLYGLLIRRVAYHPHSLERLIYLQVLCSAVASWLVCFALSTYFNVRFWIAAALGILCALEPLQLMMERFVMTEATSNLLFAVHFVLLLAYVKRGELWTLLLAQCVGVLAIAIRISFLPELLVNSMVAPMLSPQALALWRAIIARIGGAKLQLRFRQSALVACHLGLCLLVSQGLLTAYKHLNGRVSGREPGLLYASGTFLLSDFAPLIESEDFPIAAQRDAVFKKVSIDRHDPDKRGAQHFMQGGLMAAIYSQFPNGKQANDVASATAVHALLRQPFSALKLASVTFASYFDSVKLHSLLLDDQGQGRQLSETVRDWLHNIFRVQNPTAYQMTVTKRWHLLATPWYWMILLGLLASPLLLLVRTGHSLSLRILCAVTALIFLVGATLTVEHPTPRYLTTDAWLVLLMFGIVLDACFSSWKNI